MTKHYLLSRNFHYTSNNNMLFHYYVVFTHISPFSAVLEEVFTYSISFSRYLYNKG